MNVLVLLVLSQVVSQPVEAPREEPKWEIFVGASGGLRPDSLGGGGAGLIGVSRVFFGFLRPELWLGAGGYSQATDVLTMFRAGVRLEWPGLERWHPFINVGYAHQQEAQWHHVVQDPVGVITGLGGVNHSHESGAQHVLHRNGIETGLGVAYQLPLGRFAARLTLKGAVAHFFEAGPPRYVELTTLVGFCF
ncbi:MAG: hypothetical protein DI536_18825 [Archangium gephyra]|uniref:Outer membrane protein beta-barrel domain-containing protein n=1 Tax=Archangium gephyra TaxID=48 RepID=A0A2W5T9Z4_9BACT|nr:MAG: hypothetical protein DI536_18825 [Archangium gephyra]